MKIKLSIKQILLTLLIAAVVIALIIGNAVCYTHADEITSHLIPAEEIVIETKVKEENAPGKKGETKKTKAKEATPGAKKA